MEIKAAGEEGEVRTALKSTTITLREKINREGRTVRSKMCFCTRSLVLHYKDNEILTSTCTHIYASGYGGTCLLP